MSEPLGGNAPFSLSPDETPIAYRTGEFLNSSDSRFTAAGGGLEGFVTITQDNFAEMIRAIADLERRVNSLAS